MKVLVSLLITSLTFYSMAQAGQRSDAEIEQSSEHQPFELYDSDAVHTRIISIYKIQNQMIKDLKVDEANLSKSLSSKTLSPEQKSKITEELETVSKMKKKYEDDNAKMVNTYKEYVAQVDKSISSLQSKGSALTSDEKKNLAQLEHQLTLDKRMLNQFSSVEGETEDDISQALLKKVKSAECVVKPGVKSVTCEGGATYVIVQPGSTGEQEAIKGSIQDLEKINDFGYGYPNMMMDSNFDEPSQELTETQSR